MNRLRSLFLIGTLFLFPALAHADPIGLITLGDSLTDTYSGKPYAGTNSGWTDLVTAYRGASLTINNFAAAGSTSTALLANGQHTSAINIVNGGGTKYVTLAIGANDVLAFVNQIDAGNPATFDPTPHAATLVGNVASTVAALQAAGAKVILANVPDITDTPAMKAALAGQPAVTGLVQTMTDAVNAQLKQLALDLRIPLVDLDKLNAVGNSPFLLGGTDVSSHLYSVDGFHPSSLGAGLLANAELVALLSYGVDVPRFSESELLGLAGLNAANLGGLYDPNDFIVKPAPEPSSLVLLGLGAGVLAIRRRRQAA